MVLDTEHQRPQDLVSTSGDLVRVKSSKGSRDIVLAHKMDNFGAGSIWLIMVLLLIGVTVLGK